MSWFSDLSAVVADIGIIAVGGLLLLVGLFTEFEGMTSIVGVATKPIGHALIIAGTCIVCLGGGKLYVHERIKTAIAENTLATQLAVDKAVAKSQAAGQQALERVISDTARLASQSAQVKEIIRHAPPSTGCAVGNPVVHDVLERVRITAAAGAGHPEAAGVAAPGATGAAHPGAAVRH